MARIKTTKHDNFVIECYNKGMTLQSIANILGFSGDWVRTRLQDNNIYIKPKTFPVDKSSPIFADNFPANNNDWFMVGILLSDGSVCCNKGEDIGRVVTLELEDKDLPSLLKIHGMYAQGSKIGKRKNRPLSSIRWCSTSLCEKLENYGIQPNKSKKPCIDFTEELFKSRLNTMAFLCGYFCGDGCFSKGKKHTDLKFNITANTGVSVIVKKVLDHLGFDYSILEYKTYSSFNINNPTESIKLFSEMLKSSDLTYERRIDRFLEIIGDYSENIKDRVKSKEINNLLLSLKYKETNNNGY